jgi:hypothetical protein
MGHAEAFAFGDIVARLLATARVQRAPPDRLGLVRPPRGERGHPARREPGDVDLRQHRRAARQLRALRRLVRLEPSPPHERPRVLQVEPVAVPQALREGARLPQGELGQLGPGGSDRARQRAGPAGWHVRALRSRRRQEEAHAVVLQDHRLRGPPAGRSEPARGVVAAQGARHAAQLDRSLDRCGRRFRDRGLRPQGHGLHDAPGHAVRCDVHGRGPRLRPRGGPRRGLDPRGAGGVRRLPRAGAEETPRSNGRTPPARRRVSRSSDSRSTRSTASGSRSGRQTTCSPTTGTAQ